MSGVHNGHIGDVVHINAHELAHPFRVGYDVVDGNLGRLPAVVEQQCGNGMILRVGHTLKGNNVRQILDSQQ